jgi:hypothetical protein
MALKKCKECGKDVSTQADKCPHCGACVKTQIGCLGAIAVILGVLILIGIIGSLNRETPTPPRPPTAAELEAKRQAEERARKAEEQFLKTPAGKLWQKHKDWDRQYCDAIVNRKVMSGMNPQQVRAAWGRPEHINRTVIPGHTAEQWVYGDTYLYFDDGILTSWQDTR